MCTSPDDPLAKTIVFSQWPAVLVNLSKSLTANDIRHVNCANRASGAELAKAIGQWKLNDEARVLLLPLNAGARGLNLTEATRIFFVEPPLTAAMESQAIARIHRIGQAREMHVYRFVVRQSIEQVVYEMRHGESTQPPNCVNGHWAPKAGAGRHDADQPSTSTAVNGNSNDDVLEDDDDAQLYNAPIITDTSNALPKSTRIAQLRQMLSVNY